MILAIDTSGRSGSPIVLALSDGAQIIDERMCDSVLDVNIGATEQFRPLITSLLGKRSLSDISAIGVIIGPGSFTGVRTGLAFAEGLAIGSERELFGIDILRAALVQRHNRGEQQTQQTVAVRSITGGSDTQEYFWSHFVLGTDESGPTLISATPVEAGVLPARSSTYELTDEDLKGLARGAALGRWAANSRTRLDLTAAVQPLELLYGKAVNARTLVERGIPAPVSVIEPKI